jgi:hypothetical protein
MKRGSESPRAFLMAGTNCPQFSHILCPARKRKTSLQIPTKSACHDGRLMVKYLGTLGSYVNDAKNALNIYPVL